jgi:hypothetical protein
LRRLDVVAKRGEVRRCGVRRGLEYLAEHPTRQFDGRVVIPVSASDQRGDQTVLACGWVAMCSGARVRRILVQGSTGQSTEDECWLVLCRKMPVE